ncbi:hypothetical protein FRC12_006683 [Ceratobasidium sp. 428]|nr:hypothetical protein FRC09_000452 [Ceratobasidium sp. 395]KAG8766732.1 hypothetical protein FRC12_006683 [Ceratobasidium sp. 428]
MASILKYIRAIYDSLTLQSSSSTASLTRTDTPHSSVNPPNVATPSSDGLRQAPMSSEAQYRANESGAVSNKYGGIGQAETYYFSTFR